MTALDMTKVYRDFKGKWVALEGPNSNKVVASGKDLKKVVEEAKKKGVEIPTVAQIPKKLMTIVGANLLRNDFSIRKSRTVYFPPYNPNFS